MKATYKNCFEMTTKVYSNFSETAKVRVAEDAEDLCWMLYSNGLLPEADDEQIGEIDEKNLKAIVCKFGHSYRTGVNDTYQAMQEAASNLI